MAFQGAAVTRLFTAPKAYWREICFLPLEEREAAAVMSFSIRYRSSRLSELNLLFVFLKTHCPNDLFRFFTYLKKRFFYWWMEMDAKQTSPHHMRVSHAHSTHTHKIFH